MSFVCFEKKLSFSKDLKKLFSNTSFLSFGEIRSPLQITDAKSFFIDLSFSKEEIVQVLHSIDEKSVKPPVYLIYEQILQIGQFVESTHTRVPLSFLSYTQIKEGHFPFSESLSHPRDENLDLQPQHSRYWHWETLEELLGLYQNQSVNENNLLKWISHYLQSERLVLYKRSLSRFDFISSLKFADEGPFSSLHFLDSDPLIQKLKHRQSCVALSGWVSQINHCGQSIESLITSMKMVGALLLETGCDTDYLLFFNHRETGIAFSWEEIFNVKKISEYLLNKRHLPLDLTSATAESKKANMQKSISESFDLLPHLSKRISNEFKNAIVSIQTFTQLLPEKYKDTHFRKDFFNVVEREVSRLEHLLDRIAFFQSPYIPSKQNFLLYNLITDAIVSIKHMAPQTECILNFKLDRAFTYLGEEEKLSHAVKEILINAVQANLSKTHSLHHSHSNVAGSSNLVTIDICNEETATSRLCPNIKISITDQGEGLSEDISSHLFKPFNSNKSSGLGIGLVFSKTIIHAHGGALSLKHTGLTGSTWTITLPTGIDTQIEPYIQHTESLSN